MSQKQIRKQLLVCVVMAMLVVFGACSSDNDSNMMQPTPESTYDQVDRKGIPAINTVFNHPSSAAKTTYNTADPANDVAANMAAFQAVLTAVANDDPAGTAGALLPDVLPVNLATAISNFASLDGRKLADDATDVALSVVIGSSLSFLHSDNVATNDQVFLNTFPYLAPPN